MVAENGYYFLLGRHTGLFPYAPFSLVALVLFLLHARRSAARWLTLLALASIGLYFLCFIAFNWHGGGGFIGNRYFVMAYPAFLFLVTRLGPGWLTGAGYAAGALFLGAILTTPYGAPVHRPTLQAHTRGPAFSWLPLELSLRRQIPGYWGDLETDVWFWGRKDVFEPHGTEFLIHGATTVEVWMMARQPLGEVALQIRNPAAKNRVELSLGGDRQVLEFDRPATTQVVLRPRRPFSVRREGEVDNHVYRLFVTTSTIQILEIEFEPEDGVQRPPKYFPAGARIAYLGSPAELEADVYTIDWEASPPPGAVGAGRTFRLPLRVRNASQGRWRHTGAARVQFSYHWLDEEGGTVVREGLRTVLPHAVEPGGAAELTLEVLAPPQAGRYVLELDAIRERVSWFSRQRPESVLRLPVEVAAAAARTEGEPEADDGPGTDAGPPY
jgi:hypothetical protein